MNKFFCVLALFCVIVFAGCEKRPAGGQSKNAGMAGMVNPMKCSGPEEILEVLGVEFKVPEMAQEVKYFLIGNRLAQMDFFWKGIDCTARIRLCEEKVLEDISGMYYSWETESDCEIGWCRGKVKYVTRNDGAIVSVCCWLDGRSGVLYSLSMIIPGIGPGDISDVKGLIEKIAYETWIPCESKVE